MGALVPLLPVLAGGATAAGGTMATISGLAGIASAGMSIAGGMAAKDQADYQARVEELNGRRQAIAINDELLKSISMNNVAAAAGGLMNTGSVAGADAASRKAAANALNTSAFNTQSTVADLEQRGVNARTSGIANALTSGAGVLGSAYNRSSTIKKTG